MLYFKDTCFMMANVVSPPPPCTPDVSEDHGANYTRLGARMLLQQKSL